MRVPSNPISRCCLIGAVSAVIAGAAIAGTSAPDVIPMDNPAYEKHKKPVVQFSHKKHAEAYGISCGECHHDGKGTPLNIKEGEDVASCIACHTIPSERPKGKNAPKLSKKERLAYHAEAMHYNCKGCHKAHNKKTGTKAAPVSCKKCHVK